MSCLMEHKEKIRRKEKQQGTRKDIKPDLTAERKIGRVRASQEGPGLVYPPVCMLYSFLNSTAAIINGVNVGIIPISWWLWVKYYGCLPTPPLNCHLLLYHAVLTFGTVEKREHCGRSLPAGWTSF